MNQTVTVNLHNPDIQDIKVQSSGTVTVELGNGPLHGSVDMFFKNMDALDDFTRDLRIWVEALDSVVATIS